VWLTIRLRGVLNPPSGSGGRFPGGALPRGQVPPWPTSRGASRLYLSPLSSRCHATDSLWIRNRTLPMSSSSSKRCRRAVLPLGWLPL
jgi:hypothetical protein